MKKLFTFLSVLVMSLFLSSVYADETISYGVGEEYTTISQLQSATGGFAIVNKADGKVLYGTTAQNLGYDTFGKAFVATNTGYLWKLVDAGGDGYYLQLITPAGTDYNCWGMGGVLNSQGEAQGWGCSFILGVSDKRGQDIANGAVYVLTYSGENGGWAIQNLGTGQYQGFNNGPAHSDTPSYFQLCSLVEEVVENPINPGAYNATDAKEFIEAGLKTSNVELSWTDGIDLSKYRYLTITLGQNSMESGDAGEVIIRDGNDVVVRGDGYGAEYQNMWFGSWNHQYTCGIDLEKLRKEHQFNIYDIRSLTVNIGGSGVIVNNIYASNVEAKTVNRWGNPNDEATFRNTSATVGGLYTICLPYAAAYAGVTVYEVVGKTNVDKKGVSGNFAVLRPIKGLMEAGKSYVYKVNDPLKASDATKIYAFFYQATAATVSSPATSNALVGTFAEVAATALPQGAKVLNLADGMFLPAENALAANSAYLDETKLASVSAGENDMTVEMRNTEVTYVWTNTLINNGTFTDANDLSSFVVKSVEGVDVSMAITSRQLVVTTGAQVSKTYDSQLFVVSNVRFQEGDKFRLSFYINADKETDVEVQAHGIPDGNHYNYYQISSETLHAGTKMKTETIEGVVTKEMAGADGLLSFAFNLSTLSEPNKFYFRNVNLKKYVREDEKDNINDHIYVKDPAPEIEGLVKVGQLQEDSKDILADWAIEGTNTVYSIKDGISVACKIKNVDVADCDYVVIKLAEPAPSGLSVAFWGLAGNKFVSFPEGQTEYKYVFAEDAECAIADNKLPQITLLSVFGGANTVKVAGVYKHKVKAVSGDLNADGEVNISDVSELVKVILDGSANSAADIDGNGAVNIKDIETLVNTILGK